MSLNLSSTISNDVLKEIFEFLGTPTLRSICQRWKNCLEAHFAILFQSSPMVKVWIPRELTDKSGIVCETAKIVWTILRPSTQKIIRQAPLTLEAALTVEHKQNLIIFFTAIKKMLPPSTATPSLTENLSKNASEIKAWMNSNEDILRAITRLNLSDLTLTLLPPEIEKLTKLKHLYLKNNKLSSLPLEFAQLTSLECLDLSNNRFTSLPPQIGQLTKLDELYLQNNQLASLLPQIGQLTMLKRLYLNNNKLSSLPPQIGELTHLQCLKLENNLLNSLPPEIGRLTTLERLYLNNNKLSSLPPEIEKLRELIFLYLENNRLTLLPPEITGLNLKRLDLSGNPCAASQSQERYCLIA